MNNIIEKVLEEHADLQLNLASEAARKILAESITKALLNEINDRHSKETDIGRKRFLRPRTK